MITEIILNNSSIQFYPAEAPVTMIAVIPDIPEPEKLYFRVCNGPYLWPEIEEGRLVWRIAQHERRLWQSGESVVFGHWSESPTEIALSPDQQTILQTYFL